MNICVREVNCQEGRLEKANNIIMQFDDISITVEEENTQ